MSRFRWTLAGSSVSTWGSSGRNCELVESSRLEVFPEAGHFPQLDKPQRFLDVRGDLMDTTEANIMAPEQWRELLRD